MQRVRFVYGCRGKFLLQKAVILRTVPIMNVKKQLLLGCAFGALAAITPAIAAPPAPVYNWTGWYVGGNIGYSWGHGAVTYNEPAFGAFGLPRRA